VKNNRDAENIVCDGHVGFTVFQLAESGICYSFGAAGREHGRSIYNDATFSGHGYRPMMLSLPYYFAQQEDNEDFENHSKKNLPLASFVQSEACCVQPPFSKGHRAELF